MFKALAITAVGGMALLMSSAQAAPTFAGGSFSIVTATDSTDDITTATSFNLTLNPVVFTSAHGDFTGNLISGILITNPIDFANDLSFGFSDPAFGTFTPTSGPAVRTSTVTGINAATSFDVEGTFTLGTEWANAGATLSANETWSLTQTGGVGNAVSLSATFHSPAAPPGPPPSTPEPATLTLFGAGLAGLGWLRSRKKK